MFNPLGAAELIAGMGGVMRGAAGAEGALDDFARGQLLSAGSVAALLAKELAAQDALLGWARRRIAEELAEAECAPELARAAERVAASRDGVALGAALTDLLADLRHSGRDPDVARRIGTVLRELAEHELAALAGEPLRLGQPQ